MGKEKDGQRREFFRLRYPESEQPKIKIANIDYQVLEISEAGARIRLDAGQSVSKGQDFAGILQFRDGAFVLVRGVVARVEEDVGVLKLSPGVSLRRMLVEQRQVLQRYLDTLED